MINHPFIVTLEIENAFPPYYVMRFPDIPSVIADGATADEAFEHGRELYEEYIDNMETMGLEIPEPTTFCEGFETLFINFRTGNSWVCSDTVTLN